MSKIILSINADNGEELAQLLSGVLKLRHPPSWVGEEPPPLDPQSVEDAQTLSDAEYDAKHPGSGDSGDDPEPEPPSAPSPPPTAKKRKARAVAPPPLAPPEPELNLAPKPEPESEKELPALEALKSAVTNAVRLAQKGEGSKKILDLLPGFKDTTGLSFVMNAEDKHRSALYDLVLAADLTVV